MNAAPADALAEGFRRALAAGRLGHAWHIVGPPRGAGGELSDRLARIAACRAPEIADRPCDRCPACRQIAEKRHADLVFLEPESKSRRILIEAVRERVAPLVTRTSYEGGWKVVMVWYADRLQEDAANALLKMLEEPPPRTLFLLVADSDQPLLSTIASRCQRLYAGGGRPPRLAPETRAALLDLLAEGPGAGYVERVAHAARFAARLAAVRAELEKSDPAADGDDDAAREVRDARINARLLEARDEALELAARALRDVLLCRLGRPAAELHWPERADVSRRLAQRVTPGAALRNLRLVEEAHTQMERYLAESQVLESFYLRWEEDAAERNGP